MALSPQISDEARRAAAVIANGRFHLVALLSSTHAQLPLKPSRVSTKIYQKDTRLAAHDSTELQLHNNVSMSSFQLNCGSETI